jgi:hypothetical protein
LVVNANDPNPPPDGNAWPEPAREYEQLIGAGAGKEVNVGFAIVYIAFSDGIPDGAGTTMAADANEIFGAYVGGGKATEFTPEVKFIAG